MRGFVTGCLLLALVAGSGAKAESTEAEEAFQSGQFEAARALYAKELAASPKDVKALSRSADLALFDDRLGDAERYLRTLGALEPKNQDVGRGMAEIAVRRGTKGEYSITGLASGVEIPFVASEPLPVVRLRVNGKRDANFLIDTGAPGVVIDERMAKTLGLNVETSGTGVFAGGVRAGSHETSVGSLGVGGVTVEGIPAMVMPLEHAPAPKGMRIDGIVGTTFFYHFLATIDYKRQRLVLRPRVDSAAFEKKARLRGDAATRMWLVPDHFLFARAKVNGTYSALLNIDTGGEGIGIQATKATLEGAGIVTDSAHPGTFMTPMGEVATLPFKATVAVGSRRVADLEGTYFPSGDQYGIFPFRVGGTLSDQFFRGSAVTFDFWAMLLVVGED
jgi:predicted aspartyl protease